MIDCSAINAAIADGQDCETTDAGTVVSTMCLYPSFDQVRVFVVDLGDGLIAHDGAGAARSAWSHGVEPAAFAKALEASARAFGCSVSQGHIQIKAQGSEWLWSAIAAVANASADAARAAVGRIRVSVEESLIIRTKALLDRARWKPDTKLNYVHPGESGKLHTFDLSISHGGALALIDAVVPHPTSVAAKYLAFSDTASRPGLYKYALYENELAVEDKSLLSNVADLVSYKSISGTDGHFLLQ